MCCNFTPLELIGLALSLYLIGFKPAQVIFNWLRNRFARTSSRILRPNQNDYAVVTGSTDGIGLEYARQLAEKGYNLLLLSRTEEKLKKVASDIKAQNTQCKKVS